MDEREILRYYTISDEELQIINKQRGAANRLGFAIQITYLRFPGRPLSANEKVPDFIVHTIAKQLRHATLMAFLIHIYAFLTDQGIEMLEKLMGRMFNRGEKKLKDHFQKDGKAINEKVRLYAKV